MLDNFDLTERVREPTHKLGHQLDVFITRSDQPVLAMKVYPPLLLSDHSLITVSFAGRDKLSVPRRPRIKRRCWKRLDIESFTADLIESDLVANPPSEVTELFDCYNTTLKKLVDRHVPVVTVTSYSQSNAPWFDRKCSRAKAKTRRFKKIFRKKQDGASEWKWLEQFQLQKRLYSSKFSTFCTERTLVAVTQKCCGLD